MFWRQTPRETACHLDAIRAAERRHYARGLYVAWHAALFSRMDRLPELEPLMERVRRGGTEEQSPEEQMQVARMIAASFEGAFGG